MSSVRYFVKQIVISLLGDNECTVDNRCGDIASYLSQYGTARTCSDGSMPINIFGTCADNSSLGCYSSYPVPPGLPTTAFPNGDFIFCYTNRSVASCNFHQCTFTRVTPRICCFVVLDWTYRAATLTCPGARRCTLWCRYCWASTSCSHRFSCSIC